MSSNNASHCNSHTFNGTQFGISSKYNGIVENTIISVIYWTIGMILFLMFRQYVADSYMGDRRISQKLRNIVTAPTHIRIADIKELNPFHVIFNVLKLSLKDIGEKCGPDATRYLYFQRYLIGYITILSVLSLAIILPINFQGTLGVNSSQFAASTIMNIPAGSSFLWAHIIVQFIGTLIGFGILTQYVKSSDVLIRKQQRQTLMIRKVPKEYCNYRDLKEFFSQSIPDVVVEDVTISYPLWDANRSNQMRQYQQLILKGCDELEENYGRAGVVHTCCSGHLCARYCCSCGHEYDARDYYTAKYDKVDKEFRKRCEIALENPTGIVFVTFGSDSDAATAKDFLKILRKGIMPPSPFDIRFETKKWITTYAPEANNVQWENMSEQTFTWYLRIVILNVSLCYLAIVLSTPSMILNTIDKMLTSTEIFNTSIASILPIFFVNILPPLILKMVSSVLPTVIGYTGHLERHWRRSTRVRIHITKSYFFVLFTVLIIPSLGLMSITGFLRWIFEIDFGDGNYQFQWQCIFLPDNGAFYVNYLITCALMSCANDLLRIADLIGLGINILSAESAVMKRTIYELYTSPFPYNGNYASMLVNLAIITTYAVICPLVCPVGLMYILLKYYTDKYLIYYTTAPMLIKQRVHLAAARCGYLGFIVPSAFLLLFTILKSKTFRDPLFIVQTIFCSITTILAVSGRHLPFDHMFDKVLSPLQMIPFLNEYLVNEQETKFDRYYPHYLLPFIRDGYAPQEKKGKDDLNPFDFETINEDEAENTSSKSKQSVEEDLDDEKEQ